MEPQEGKAESARDVTPLPSRSIEEGSSRQLSKPHTNKLVEKSSLTSQCVDCAHLLKVCISYAQQASIELERRARTQLEGVRKRLLENRFRLDVWISDCKASEEPNLNELSIGITKALKGAFSIIHENLSAIEIGIGQLQDAALEIRTDENKHSYVTLPSVESLNWSS